MQGVSSSNPLSVNKTAKELSSLSSTSGGHQGASFYHYYELLVFQPTSEMEAEGGERANFNATKSTILTEIHPFFLNLFILIIYTSF